MLAKPNPGAVWAHARQACDGIGGLRIDSLGDLV